MSIPDFQSIMLPLMQLASDGKEHSFRDSVEYLAKLFNCLMMTGKSYSLADNNLPLIIVLVGQKHI